MELLAGTTLFRKNGEELTDVDADSVVNESEILALYFSAHWCPPCRHFTPVLADFYAKAKEKEKAFEIIFVSRDEGDEEMKKYMLECHGDWLAVPYDSTELREKLDEKFEIDGIPTLIILKNGSMVTNSGRWDVQLKPDECYDLWVEGNGATTEEDVDKFFEDMSKEDEANEEKEG